MHKLRPSGPGGHARAETRAKARASRLAQTRTNCTEAALAHCRMALIFTLCQFAHFAHSAHSAHFASPLGALFDTHTHTLTGGQKHTRPLENAFSNCLRLLQTGNTPPLELSGDQAPLQPSFRLQKAPQKSPTFPTGQPQSLAQAQRSCWAAELASLGRRARFRPHFGTTRSSFS